jgi:hypothetical protein
LQVIKALPLDAPVVRAGGDISARTSCHPSMRDRVHLFLRLAAIRVIVAASLRIVASHPQPHEDPTVDGHINPYASPADPSQAPPLVAEVVVDDRGWTIDYELTVEDLVRWNQYFLRTSPTMRRQFWTMWVLLGVLFITLAVVVPQAYQPRNLNFERWILSAVLGLPFVGLWLAYPWYFRRKYSHAVRAFLREGANQNVVGPRRLSISPEFIVFSTPLLQTVTRWQAVEHVVHDTDAVYIKLSSTTALNIPRRAFDSEQQARHFVARAIEFQAAAIKSRPVGTPA